MVNEIKICPTCSLTIERGEEYHPTAVPFHVPCRDHHQCYVLCIDAHPDFIAWYQKTFKRDPIQRSINQAAVAQSAEAPFSRDGQ